MTKNMHRQLEKALTDQNQLADLGALLVESAFEVFSRAGCPDDFCIQTIGMRAVFGGTNRLIWSARHGFRPDRSYCTAKFLDYWDSAARGE